MWKVLLFCVLVGGGYAEAQTWLSNITDNLRSGMSSVMEMSVVNYSEPRINATYIAKLEFDMRAMGHLYNSSYLVIDAIANKQAYPEGMVSVSDWHMEIAPVKDNWRTLLSFYAGPVSIVALVLLLVAILPLVGLFWCCCQWCRVNRRRRPFDRKYDVCLKGILAIVLIGLLTLFLFGVVCAFVTESQLEGGAQATPGALRAGLADARTFLNATQAHSRHLLVDNYRELEEQLKAMLDNGGRTVLQQLDEFTSATSVQKLNQMVERLQRVPADLRAVHQDTVYLREQAEGLAAGLRKVRTDVIYTLNECKEPQCVQLQEKYKIGELQTEIDYNKIPDVSKLVSNVTRLLDTGITKDVANGLQVFSGIKKTVDQHIPRVHDAIASTGRRLAAVADEMSWLAANASERLEQQGAAADSLQDWLQRYGPYRRYGMRATAAALLAVVLAMVWGLLCGVCGKRPDVYGASDCCNKGTGATCLLCGVALMFVVAGGVALVMLGYFLVGVASQRFVCDPLTEPRDNRAFADYDRFVDLEYTLFNEHRDPTFNLTAALLSCHANRTLYQTLQLGRLYDLQGQRARADAEVRARVTSLRTDYPPRGRPLRILPPDARSKLDALADTGLSDFDFDRILDALETNMTSLALDGLARQLHNTSRALTARPRFVEVARQLRQSADRLQRLHDDIVLPMLRRVSSLNVTASKLRDELRFNHSSLKEAIQYRIRDTTEVELFLNTQGPDYVQNLTREFAEAVGARLQEYLERVTHAAEHDVGLCGPLSNALNATRDAACRAVLMPVNGFWMSLAWCLLLFAPMLAVAQRLARLYRHPDPYPGPLVEAEYLYDAYADRDNVPLANAYKAEKRSGVRGGGEGGAGIAARAGGGAAAGVAPPVDTHHARRYNDMAPKHWEEGPPRYHGPTEYERPPPYYYPGPNDRE